MSTLIVADLHLDPARPAATEAFVRFCAQRAPTATALYLLGDLFESWVGDDDDSALASEVAAALNQLAQSGVALSFIRGNRDFLLGPDYARRCGMRLLADPAVTVIAGVPTLLLHGDLLCTDDLDYQKFRAQVRDPHWQQRFLAQPLAERRAFAAKARAASRAHQQEVSESITDANAESVAVMLARYGVTRMIHGHTHRPALHRDGGRERFVVGDWYHQGSVLEIAADASACLHTLPYARP